MFSPEAIAREFPPAFAATLEAALAQEALDGDAGRERAATIRRHYFELMPAMRATQLDPARQPQATLFHTRFDLAQMPRLAGALVRLFGLLERSGVPAERALPARGPEELVARHPTLAELYPATYYGGFMPLLYGYPADLARFARDLDEAPVHAVLDRHLAAPIVHELMHLDRRRMALLPLYLDECIAAHLGVVVLPELAWPAPGEDNGLYATPWFSQVGQALARAAGLERLVRAHAGVIPWSEAFGAGFLEGALRLGRDDYFERRGPHFLSESFRPEPWLKLIYLGDRRPSRSRAELEATPWSAIVSGEAPPEQGDDVEVIEAALRSMCLENFQDQGSFRTRTRVPPPNGEIDGEVEIDLEECRATVAGGPFDPPRLAHHLPPAWALRRARESGTIRFSLRISEVEAIPSLAAVLRDGE